MVNAFGEKNEVLHALHNMEDIKRVSTTKPQKRVSSEGEQQGKNTGVEENEASKDVSTAASGMVSSTKTSERGR